MGHASFEAWRERDRVLRRVAPLAREQREGRGVRRDQLRDLPCGHLRRETTRAKSFAARGGKSPRGMVQCYRPRRERGAAMARQKPTTPDDPWNEKYIKPLAPDAASIPAARQVIANGVFRAVEPTTDGRGWWCQCRGLSAT